MNVKRKRWIAAFKPLDELLPWRETVSRVWLAIVIVGLMVVLAVTIIIRALHAVHTGETSPEVHQAYPQLSARNDLRLEKANLLRISEGAWLDSDA
jgi:hypothetical protein